MQAVGPWWRFVPIYLCRFVFVPKTKRKENSRNPIHKARQIKQEEEQRRFRSTMIQICPTLSVRLGENCCSAPDVFVFAKMEAAVFFTQSALPLTPQHGPTLLIFWFFFVVVNENFKTHFHTCLNIPTAPTVPNVPLVNTTWCCYYSLYLHPAQIQLPLLRLHTYILLFLFGLNERFSSQLQIMWWAVGHVT